MTTEYSEFVRKPFKVEATQVTKENMDEFCKLLGFKKKIQKKPDGTPYIHVDTKIIPKGFRIFEGWYVTRMPHPRDENEIVYHAYREDAFWAQFAAMDNGWRALIEAQDTDIPEEVPQPKEEFPAVKQFLQDLSGENKDESPAAPLATDIPGGLSAVPPMYGGAPSEDVGTDDWIPSEPLHDVNATTDDPS